jgi:putative ABC transport system permease protein
MGNLRYAEAWLQEVRQAVRGMARRPGFTSLVVLTLALGIGANSAIFSVVHAVLLRPLPYGDPQGLVLVWEHNRPRQRTRNVVSSANYLAWRERAGSFARLGAATLATVNLGGSDGPERLSAARTAADLFPALGVSAALGRTFLPEEEKEGAAAVVLLSHELWQRRFGGEAGIVGRAIPVNGAPHTVIGVLPARAGFPPGAELWLPLTDRVLSEAQGRYLAVVARLKPGVTRDQAQADMTRVATVLEQENPVRNAGWGANVVPLREQLVGDVRLPLLVLLGAVGAVLLIACGNVAALQLGRALERRRELAVRAAMGAGSGRLARQLLTESALLGLLGGALGVLGAVWGVSGLARLLPAQVGSLIELRVNPPVLAFTAVLSLASGLLFGLAPALQAAWSDPQAALHEGGRTAGPGRARRRLGNALVVAEAALAMTLLIGAGLLLRSFARLSGVDTGFRPENVLALEVSLAGSRYGEREARAQFYAEAAERVRRLPGVVAAGGVSVLPLSGPGMATSIRIEGQPEPAPADRPTADVRMVLPGYFEAMGIPLKRGRRLDERDRDHIVINEAMAQRFWPGQDPLGRHVSVSAEGWTRAEVVGVVGDVRLISLETDPRATVYFPVSRFPAGSLALVARTQGDPLAMAGAIKAQVAALDPEQPVSRVRALQQVVDDSLQPPRFGAMLLGLFAAAAVLLAALGVYGLLADRVAARSRELGVRMALGADRAWILRHVLKQGLGLTLLGCLLGLLAGGALSRVIERLLFRLPPWDPWTFATVPLLLIAAGALASYLPARRAARVDPLVAMRTE